MDGGAWLATVHGVAKSRTRLGDFTSLGNLPDPGIEPRSPTLQADSLPAEPPVKLKNTGVGSLSLLHGIFPTQELNQDLLHCRQILYRLSYEGSILADDTHISCCLHYKNTRSKNT